MHVKLARFEGYALIEASDDLFELLHLPHQNVADLFHVLDRGHRLLVQVLVVIIQGESLQLDSQFPHIVFSCGIANLLLDHSDVLCVVRQGIARHLYDISCLHTLLLITLSEVREICHA